MKPYYLFLSAFLKKIENTEISENERFHVSSFLIRQSQEGNVTAFTTFFEYFLLFACVWEPGCVSCVLCELITTLSLRCQLSCLRKN
jgi:hypothetical protein